MLTQIQKKNLIKYTRIFRAETVSDIPPYLWHFIGFTGRNEDKINFLIRFINR